MIEKSVEKELYHAGHIPEGENFIAITDTVYHLLPASYAQDFKLLVFREGSDNAPIDSEGNSKLYKQFDILFPTSIKYACYYQSYKNIFLFSLAVLGSMTENLSKYSNVINI